MAKVEEASEELEATILPQLGLERVLVWAQQALQQHWQQRSQSPLARLPPLLLHCAPTLDEGIPDTSEARTDEDGTNCNHRNYSRTSCASLQACSRLGRRTSDERGEGNSGLKQTKGHTAMRPTIGATAVPHPSPAARDTCLPTL